MDEVITLGDSDEDDAEIIEETKFSNLDPKREMVKEQLEEMVKKRLEEVVIFNELFIIFFEVVILNNFFFNLTIFF